MFLAMERNVVLTVFATSRYDIRSGVGLSENTPQKAAGIRTDPPVQIRIMRRTHEPDILLPMSVPTPRVLPRSACSAPSPPDEPPHDRFWLWGLSVRPIKLLIVSPNCNITSASNFKY